MINNELDLWKAVLLSSSGILTIFIGYVLGRKLTDADIENKKANTSKVQSEKNAQDIENLHKIVIIYQKRVDEIQKELNETKTGAEILIRILEKKNRLLAKQYKTVKAENALLRKKLDEYIKCSSSCEKKQI